MITLRTKIRIKQLNLWFNKIKDNKIKFLFYHILFKYQKNMLHTWNYENLKVLFRMMFPSVLLVWLNLFSSFIFQNALIIVKIRNPIRKLISRYLTSLHAVDTNVFTLKAWSNFLPIVKLYLHINKLTDENKWNFYIIIYIMQIL